MIVAQVIATFFAALVIIKSYDDFKRGRESLVVALFWSLTWLGVAVIALFPSISDWAKSNLFANQAGLGTILGIALIFLLFLCYRLYIKADRNEKTINKLVSELAIKQLRPKKDTSVSPPAEPRW